MKKTPDRTIFFPLMAAMLTGGVALSVACTRAQGTLEDRLTGIRWVDYTPTNANPDRGIEPSLDSIRADLSVLSSAGFTGIVTYSSSGVMGRPLVSAAAAVGFEALIAGIWDPSNASEISEAKEAAKSPLLAGICVGNEGLMNNRYSVAVLTGAMKEIRRITGKPVTTTEISQRYTAELLTLGDWVFPNTHPYFSNHFDPQSAVEWTKSEYDRIVAKASRVTILKEVGLPTAGNNKVTLSEENQCRYYAALAKTNVKFAYFEAFDQPWKSNAPVEPYWGIFRQDRSPKALAHYLISNMPCHAAGANDKPGPQNTAPIISEGAFYVYRDDGSAVNHYSPSGLMGDVGDIRIRPNWSSNPKTGETCIRVEYSARGTKPTCEWKGPCNWAGVYWQEPPMNWGTKPEWKDAGYNLSRYKTLRFWARSENPATIEFKVGGIVGPYGDSLRSGLGRTVDLNTTWTEYAIDLTGANLTHIIGGFAWSASKDNNPRGATFYLDEIRYEPR